MNATTMPLGKLRKAAVLALLLLPVQLVLVFAAPDKKAAYFSDATTPNIVALLPMPPDAGTQEDLADRESSFAVYSARTPGQTAKGKAQDKLNVFHFSPSIGSAFKKGAIPKTEALFAQVDREVRTMITNAKKYYQRPYPAQVDSERFKDAIAKGDIGSYPCRNSTTGTLYALLLAEFFPDQRAAILEQGREEGWLRVQGGVVTPLDVYAGRVLGRSLASSLARNPQFLVDFEEARAELAEAMAPKADAPAVKK
ncbi:acid phosphatase (class A) [Ereboglobus sp. PH5-5]|uniref:hypothetical protein n=1 Tax=Ereboglobus sp. PH5-5 TaxID=2940529 RepID=UPI002404AB74|nr:hypothetical protein [Ereboglobus sp. PH5-5]MDF9832019.1 acid phosphatase (class A) [Ereboglobus sp. PH5-5]